MAGVSSGSMLSFGLVVGFVAAWTAGAVPACAAGAVVADPGVVWPDTVAASMAIIPALLTIAIRLLFDRNTVFPYMDLPLKCVKIKSVIVLTVR